MKKRQKKKEGKLPTGHPALNSWIELNETVKTADEETCRGLMAIELNGRRRKKFLQRIQSRLNRLQGTAAMEALEV